MDMPQQTKLFNHVRALERLEEDKKEIQDDISERKALAKADGFDTNVISYILKRRKAGEGQTIAFDDLLAEYEDALRDQKNLQFVDETKDELREKMVGTGNLTVTMQ